MVDDIGQVISIIRELARVSLVIATTTSDASTPDYNDRKLITCYWQALPHSTQRGFWTNKIIKFLEFTWEFVYVRESYEMDTRADHT